MVNDDEDLGAFIQEQRAKIARERDILKNNPPSAITDNTYNRDVSRMKYCYNFIELAYNCIFNDNNLFFIQVLRHGKENRIPIRQGAGVDNGIPDDVPIQRGRATRPPSTPRIFRLGEDYKSKKNLLQEELKKDYRKAMAEVRYITTPLDKCYI